MTRFSGKASRLAWELFKRTGKVNYYLLYKEIENAIEPTLSDYASNEDKEMER